jgi:hypothetical protein
MLTRVRDRLPDGGIRVVRPIDLRPLLGGWVNYNENSTGIDRVYIDDWEGTPTVRVFGACRPASLDWGEVAGAAFADGVEGHHAVGLTASYDLDFAQVLLAAYLNKRLLVVDAYSMFTDGSGRANYFQRDHFYLP